VWIGCVNRRVFDGGNCATEANVDAAAVPSTAIAHDIPFVVVNTAVRIPAQLLAQPQLRASEIGDPPANGVEAMQEATAARAMNDTATAPTVTPMNEWGRHGFIIAEIYKVLATMEPPCGSSCVYEAMARRFPEIDLTALQMTVLAVLVT